MILLKQFPVCPNHGTYSGFGIFESTNAPSTESTGR